MGRIKGFRHASTREWLTCCKTCGCSIRRLVGVWYHVLTPSIDVVVCNCGCVLACKK